MRSSLTILPFSLTQLGPKTSFYFHIIIVLLSLTAQLGANHGANEHCPSCDDDGIELCIGEPFHILQQRREAKWRGQQMADRRGRSRRESVLAELSQRVHPTVRVV